MIARVLIGFLVITLLWMSGCRKSNQFDQQLTGRHPVINEIMMNPNNGILPPYEWLELYNPSAIAISLKDYTLRYDDQSFAFPDLFLPAQQYVIVTNAENEQALASFGNVCPIAGWPPMSNTGASLALLHEQFGTVDQVSYTNQWYQSVEKRAGGWSLERINPHLNCNLMQTWAESIAHDGGTPGRQNSRYNGEAIPDLQVLEANYDTRVVTLVMNMPLENVLNLNRVHISPGLETNVGWAVHKNTIRLTFHQDLAAGVPYMLNLEGQFCNLPITISQHLFRETEVSYNDVVINEVLFNPYPGSPTFVEIYNRSDKIINLQGWLLGNRVLTMDPLFLLPNSFQLITTSPQGLLPHYPSAVLSDVIVLPSLPSYANQQGIVTLYSPTQLIDSLHYTATMHQPFLRNVQGVSLERISAFSPTNQAGNFISASTYSEGATPGYENSRVRSGTITQNRVWIAQPLLDRQGVDSHRVLRIQYEFVQENTMVNLHIYDSKGRLVNRLVRNRGVGYSGTFTWDGMRENGARATPGIHIMWLEIYHQSGTRQTFKEPFVLK